MSNPLRELLGTRKALISSWVTLGSPLAVEICAVAGFDLVTIDMQHGVGGNAELHACLTAARAAGVPSLVRTAQAGMAHLSRPLDAGASGIVCPMVNSPADARAVVECAKYPPLGSRSFGPYRAAYLGPGDYFSSANASTICGAQIETAEAMTHLDAILAVEGLDLVLVGPFDLSISLGNGRQPDTRRPDVIAALGRILEACRRHGVIAGIYCGSPDYANDRIAEGWELIALSSDAELLETGARAALGQIAR